MLKRLLLSLLLLFCYSFLFAQNKKTCEDDCTCSLSGKIIDGQTGEPIPFVSIQIKGTTNGATTDAQGVFSIENLCEIEFDILISHVGYKSLTHHHDSYHGDVKIELAPNEMILESIVVEGEQSATGLRSVTESTLSGKDLSTVSTQSLGEVAKNISGVSTLKTGSNVVKPIIHGLHSNRILIINNGVRHESQDWGESHAPEIDASLANEISVIKGASAVKYGPNALGGVIVINPPKLKLDDHFHGEVKVQGESNGRAIDGSLLLQKGVKNFAWMVQGAGRMQGDMQAPDYNLSNTGMQEYSFAAGALYHWRKLDLSFFYSHLDQNLGVLRGSVIGNLDDLADAISDDQPEFTTDFTYDINSPRQQVSHDLAKLAAEFNWEHSSLDISYGFQTNKREEYDVRRGSNNERPAINLELFTHTLQADWIHDNWRGWEGTIGGQFIFQDNNNLPGTNTLPFVPNYNNTQGGVYIAESKDLGGLIFEVGMRYDFLATSVRGRNNDNSIFKFDRNYQSLSGILGLESSLGAYTNLKINIASAWRAPNISELFSYGKVRSTLQYGILRYNDNSFPADDLVADNNVKNELGYKLTTAVKYSKENLTIEATPFINYISNYIYAEPKNVLNTVRGSFPAFGYETTDALFMGMDATVMYNHNNWLDSKVIATYLYAKDISKDAVLFGVPANRVSYVLQASRKLDNKYLWSNSLMIDYVFEQFRAPRVIDAETFINTPNFDPFENSNAPFDFVKQPDGYMLLSFKTNLNIKQWIMGIQIHNILNESYREYTDFLRYFSDQPGINFKVSITYQI